MSARSPVKGSSLGQPHSVVVNTPPVLMQLRTMDSSLGPLPGVPEVGVRDRPSVVPAMASEVSSRSAPAPV